MTCLCAARARAEVPPDPLVENRPASLDAPAPPTLPALTHKDLAFTFEYTAAVIQPNDASRSGDAFGYFGHVDLEVPIVPRAWFFGFAADFAAANVPGVGKSFLPGNPEISGRGVWSSLRGLSSGAGLGVLLPFPRELSLEEAEVLRTVRTVRPWDVASFSSLALTLRPWFDIRHVTWRFVFQLRQALDWSISLKGPEPGETISGAKPRITDLRARLTFYTGFRATENVGLGVEVWEVYELTKDLATDDTRATFAVSPSIRLLWPRVQPAISFLFPLATPLRGDVQSFYALRVNLRFGFDATPSGAASSPEKNRENPFSTAALGPEPWTW